MASFQKRGAKWRALVHIDGKLRSKSFPTKAMAAQWAREMETARDKGKVPDPRADDLTFDDLWPAFFAHRKATMSAATVARNETHWRTRVQPRFGSVKVARLRRSEVQGWVAEMVEGKVGVPTLEAALRLLSALCEAAIGDDLIESNPARGVRIPRHAPARRRFVTDAELAKVLAKVDDDHDRLLLAVMASTGIRIGEALGLTKADLGPNCDALTIHRVKTRAGYRDFPKSNASRRTVPVPPALRPALVAHTSAMLPGASIFVGDDRNIAQRVLGPACTDAKVKPFNLHALRHHAASTWIANGLSLFEVSRALGHGSTRTVDAVYGHLTPTHGDRLLAAMSAPDLAK